MNIQEAEKSIGNVVSFNLKTKPYKNASGCAAISEIDIGHGWIRSVNKDDGDCCVVITNSKYKSIEVYINAKHIDLKNDMKPIKIRLYDSSQFKFAFKKLIKLGYHTNTQPPAFAQYIYTLKDGRICYDFFKSTDEKLIVWSDDENPDELLNYFNSHESIEVPYAELSNFKFS